VNPYVITGPAQICFSGGRTSGFMLHEILEANGGLPKDCFVTFQNTGKEREETLEFINECAERWRVSVNWLEWDGFGRRDDGKETKGKARVALKTFETASRNGEPFERLTEALGILPNPIARICTAHMKVKVGTAFMFAQGFEEFDAVMGIRADEPRRVARMGAPGRDNSGGVPNLPLARAQVSKADVLAFWKSQPFDLRLDALGDLGNCDLCFLKSRGKLVRAIQAEPERAAWWIAQEAKERPSSTTGAMFRIDRPRYSDLLREAQFNARQIPLDLEDEALIDCFCGD
jgi:3'-phosphoadenosine 5'-phosphosulfate sulfotransferase (PAPS reductase)/FAD synthetase